MMVWSGWRTLETFWSLVVEWPEESARPVTANRELATELTRAVLRAEKRLKRNLDRATLARRLNVSPASVYAYLNGTTVPRNAVFERLLDELGVSGAERGRLSTLRDATELARRLGHGPRTRRSGAAANPFRPRQLPPNPRHFVGRDAELAQLTALAAAARDSRAVGVCVIHGTAGVGKTSLATTWAHRFKTWFPDGHLYVDLRGFGTDPPVDPGEALLGFLHGLGTPPREIPTTTDVRMAFFRSLVSERRMLIVLDNGRSSEQVRPLIPSAAGCLVVVTSRDRMDSLVVREGAARISLDVMPPDEAEALLAERLGVEQLADQPGSARELVGLCAGLPLALSMVTARLVDRPDEPISALVAELHDTQDRLDFLAAPEADLDLRTVFQWSYNLLSPDSARLFRLLGLHPGPDADLSTCAALMGRTKQPKTALRELVRANLVNERPMGRFHFHELLRAYAGTRSKRDDTKADRADAMRRLLDHHLRAASSANTSIQPNDVEEFGHWNEVPAGPMPKLGSYAQAMAWFTAEHATLGSLIEYAAANGFEAHAWRLAWTSMVFLRRTGRNTSRVNVQRTAVQAARRAGDPAALATSLRLLADALARSRQREEALLLLKEALTVFQALRDDKGQLRTHLSFVRALDATGDHTRALEHAEYALRLAEADDDPLILADALAATGRQLTQFARHTDALALCERASMLYSAAGHTEGMASVLKVIGDAELLAGHVQRAIVTYQRSLDLDRSLGDRYWEAHALHRLATAIEKAGDKRTSALLRAEAIAVLDSLHHPDGAALRAMDPSQTE
jgi:tetratricopeptide (TPR) repeat protein/transcriptional regulator with XRE-family HTH domain